MKGRSHHRERPLQIRSRQLGKTAPIGKTRGVHDGIDRPEGGARRANEFRCRSRACEVAGTPFNAGAGTLTLCADRLQSLKSCRVRALSMQHQALIARREPARDRGADPGAASSDD
jgi:hypothetical protein